MNNRIVTLPDIGEGIVEGEVIEWLKKVGDPISRDEAVVTVMTDKATVELPSPCSGKLTKQYYKVGEIAKVDAPLYEIETQEEPSYDELTHHEQFSASPSLVEKLEPAKQEKQLERKKNLASPPTRKLAQELGVDIQRVSGTGKGERVTDADVIHFHSSMKAEKPQRMPQDMPQAIQKGRRAAPIIPFSTPVAHLSEDEEIPVIGLKNTVAEKMVESKYIIPHFSYFDQADATRLIKLREHVKLQAEKEGFKATYMPFFIRALSLTIRKHPILNSSFDLDHHSLIIHHHQNIGIAKHTDKGLFVCVLKEVQEMSLDGIIKSYDSLMRKADSGKLEHHDLVGSTMTITNFGPLGGLWATPIINYPEAAILGIAKIQKQPVVKNDQIEARDMLNLSWSFDHRIIDGGAAANISNTFIHFIQHPAEIL